MQRQALTDCRHSGKSGARGRGFGLCVTRLSAEDKNPASLTQDTTSMDSRRFAEKTQWLRPYTRWATRVSLNSPRWIPETLRNAPLKLSSLILRGYHRALR
jgi:hypothetical protein